MEREKYEYVNEGIRAASAYIEKHIYEMVISAAAAMWHW